jgi:hypothetical protein
MSYYGLVSVRTLRTAIDGLPPALQRRVLDYGTFINEAAPDIFIEAGVTRPTAREVDELVFVAGMRKLWSMVEFQRNTLNAITTAHSYGIQGVVARATLYTANSREVLEVNALGNELRSLFEASELMPLIRMRSIVEVARILRSQ